MIDMAFLIAAFTTLFVVIDPPAQTSIFLAITHEMDLQTKRRIAIRACITASLILILFAAFGEALLGFVGISMSAFRVAGGALLFLTAMDMLFERRTKRRENSAEEEEHPDPSIFPLAIPLIAGPGAIASIILLAGQNPGIEGLAAVVAVMLVVMAILLVFNLNSHLLGRLLGKTGLNVVTRLLGMLLAALAVQFILDGLRDFGFAG
ncbi:MarC family protein [Ruegeria hyattellae]|uniref:MarC family protein n=1 Tax=Ruegeria hyattellae TaxID=3233337 RepID=UPI00355C815C